jgi:hypothetical protein
VSAPRLTRAQRAVLALFDTPSGWAVNPLAGVRVLPSGRYDGRAYRARHVIIDRLQRDGFVEWRSGGDRITDAGRAALARHPQKGTSDP